MRKFNVKPTAATMCFFKRLYTRAFRRREKLAIKFREEPPKYVREVSDRWDID